MPPHAEMLLNSATSEFPEVITLNIGGTIFATTLTTLRSNPTSMLARMFSGFLSVTKDTNGNYFIDRDGTHFGLILNFLRDGDVDIPSSPLIRRQLLRECLFYQIQPLVERLGGAAGTSDLLLPACKLPVYSKSDVLDQATLYAVRKQQLYAKHQAAWDEMKCKIKHQFGSMAQGDSSVLTCAFPLGQDTAQIAPFIARELQEEGLRDIVYAANFQTGLTFKLDLENISDDCEEAEIHLKAAQHSQEGMLY